MPLDDALILVGRKFEEYIQDIRAKSAPPPVVPRTGGPPGSQDFLPPDGQVHYLLNLLADNRFLTLEELDKVISYLNERRKSMAAGGPGMAHFFIYFSLTFRPLLVCFYLHVQGFGRIETVSHSDFKSLIGKVCMRPRPITSSKVKENRK